MSGIHQSNMKHFPDCPYRYLLSTQQSIEQTIPMRKGLLFEAYVANRFKKEDEKSLIGRMKDDSVSIIKQHAEDAKRIFKSGEFFVPLSFFDAEGEADFIGEIEGFSGKCIADLKYTGNFVNWVEDKNGLDLLQSIYYPYIYRGMTGETLPFVYILVHTDTPNLMYRYVINYPTEYQFTQVERILSGISSSDFKPNPSQYTCIKNKFGKTCEFLDSCMSGRNFLCQPQTVVVDI